MTSNNVRRSLTRFDGVTAAHSQRKLVGEYSNPGLYSSGGSRRSTADSDDGADGSTPGYGRLVRSGDAGSNPARRAKLFPCNKQTTVNRLIQSEIAEARPEIAGRHPASGCARTGRVMSGDLKQSHPPADGSSVGRRTRVGLEHPHGGWKLESRSGGGVRIPAQPRGVRSSPSCGQQSQDKLTLLYIDGYPDAGRHPDGSASCVGGSTAERRSPKPQADGSTPPRRAKTE